LPCGIPTLQSTSTGNWTHPDNVFGMEHMVNTVISCDTNPALHGPCTDHVPIQLTLDLEMLWDKDEPHCNWHDTDWEEFQKHLKDLLAPFPLVPLVTEEEFQQAANRLTQAIVSTTEAKVLFAKPCPHSKHWWTRELTDLHKQVTKLSCTAYLMRGLPNHTCHEELKIIKSHY
ncbi:hypothetical protein BDR06DRAFT_825087, partial [Suillus hirtellus]